MAPFDELEQLVPAEGRILDLGCGNGLFSIHLALASADRTLHGVDISSYKVRQGRVGVITAGAADRVSLEVVDPGWEPPEDAYDTVVISDVLYLLDPRSVEQTVVSACRAVKVGGRLVVKEVAVSPRWKHRFTFAQEIVAVHLLRITSGGHLNPDPLTTVVETLDGAGWRFDPLALDRGYPYSHTALVAVRGE